MGDLIVLLGGALILKCSRNPSEYLHVVMSPTRLRLTPYPPRNKNECGISQRDVARSQAAFLVTTPHAE